MHLEPFKERIIWHSDEIKDLEEKTFEHLQKQNQRKQNPYCENLLRKNASLPLWQSTHLISTNAVQSVVAGVFHTTKEVIQAGLLGVGKKTDTTTISGAFLLHKKNSSQFYLLADCGVNIEPSLEDIISIAEESLCTWTQLAINKEKPRLVFLSFSSKKSANSKSSEKMALATKHFQKKYPEIECDGELQFDAAVNSEIRQKKNPTSPLTGIPNIFIFPNLDAGNIAYKILNQWGDFEAYGPLLQGLRLPFCDLSRGAKTDDIVMTSYLNLMR